MIAPPPPPEYDCERTQPRLVFLKEIMENPGAVSVTYGLVRGQVPIDRVQLPRKLR